MERFQLLLQSSPWFVVLCFLVGALYAYVLYRKKNAWGQNINYTLAGLRFITVSLICLLMLNPLVRQITSLIEKPVIAIAIDNSESVQSFTPKGKLAKTISGLVNLKQKLEAEGVEVSVHSFTPNNQDLTKINFNHQSTNLGGLLQTIETNYENRNLAGVVLVTDGIFNEGIAPTFRDYNFSVFPIGMGDTVPKIDIKIKALYHNKIAYLGSKFPISAEIHNTGFKGQTLEVKLKEGNQVIQSKSLLLKQDNGINKVDFLISTNNKGTRHFVVEVKALQGEFTLQNNQNHAYIDIIDAKEKILIVAAVPHPDLKALKSAIEEEDNYEVTTHINGINNYKDDKYDLVILHQIPDLRGSSNSILDKIISSNTSLWFILGNQSQISRFNAINSVMRIAAGGGQDKVTATFNPPFDKFTFDVDKQNLVAKFPPLIVPYGNYTLQAGAEVLLLQKLGSTTTNKPLLAINTNNNRKMAVLAGEGLWEWRLQEYSATQVHQATDELVRKLVQYLSVKEDKRRFRFYPITNEFTETERVVFETEVYNEVYEKIYNQKIDISIKGENKKTYSYSFVNTESNSRLDVGNLPHGIYHYTATTKLGGKVEQSTGEFSVKEIQLEALNTTADYAMLWELATQTNGHFYKNDQIDELARLLTQNKPKNIVRSTEDLKEIIHLKWLFFLILILISTEWLVRRLKGSY